MGQVDTRRIKPHKYQKKVLRSKKRFIAAISGVQGGKTFCGCLWLLQRIQEDMSADYLITAPTHKILLQATLKKWFDLFPKDWGTWKQQDSTIKLVGGGEVFIRSADDPEHLEGMKVRAAWLDEAGQMKYQVWINLMGRLAIHGGRAIMTTTPYNMGWLYTDVYKPWKAGDKSFDVIQFESKDNPYFPEEEFYRLKKILSPEEFDRRYKGIFRKLSGLIYQEFDESNLMDYYDPKSTDEIFCGLDFGFGHPTAMIFVARTKEGKFIIFDEIYQSKMLIKVLADKIKNHWAYSRILCVYADPSAAQEIAELSAYGINGITKANNDVDVGINRVRLQIRNNNLKIVKPKCPNLIDEMELYQYKENKEGGTVRDQPLKVHDDAVDAMRYALIERAGNYSGTFLDNSKQENNNMDAFDRMMGIGRYAPVELEADSFTGYF